jgi:hypothetical protein
VLYDRNLTLAKLAHLTSNTNVVVMHHSVNLLTIPIMSIELDHPLSSYKPSFTDRRNKVSIEAIGAVKYIMLMVQI